MLFFILVFLAFYSIALAVIRRDEYALLMLGLCVCFIAMFVGIIIYTAKTGGLSAHQKVFLFLSADIQRWLSFLIFPLDKLGYLIAMGRCLVPLFLLMTILNSSMHPRLNRLRKWRFLLVLCPMASLVLYFPRVFYTVVRNRFALQKAIITGTIVWIALYLLLAVVILLQEYASITIPYFKRQFRFIVISLLCITFLYAIYCVQDPIQVYQLYTAEYMWFNGLSYANPSLTLGAWTVLTFSTVLLVGLGFWNLVGYTRHDISEDESGLKRKFDAASMGASVFVHSIKNQLLAEHVLHKKLRQAVEQPEHDRETLLSHIVRLEEMNSSMLQRMDELYQSVKSNSISLSPVGAHIIAQLAVERLHSKYPEAAVELIIGSADPILADKVHLSEAIYNLLTNAYDAVLAAGRGEEGKVQLLTHDERLYIVFEVRDNGLGLDRQERRKVFDPFYTSKNTNNNWGMGLYYVRQIVQSHLGLTRITSEKGRGTSFFVMLPRYAPQHVAPLFFDGKAGEK